MAGDRALGRRFLKELRPFVFGRPFGADALREVLDVKQRLDQKMAERAETDRHVKLGFGGIREIEFVVQALQLRHAQRRPGLRERGTLPALRALARGRRPSRAGARGISSPPTSSCVTWRTSCRWWRTPRPTPCPASRRRSGPVPCAWATRTGPTPAEELLLRDYRRHTTAANRVFRVRFEAGAAST